MSNRIITLANQLVNSVDVAGDARAIANRGEGSAEAIEAAPNGIFFDNLRPRWIHGREHALKNWEMSWSMTL